MIAKLVFSGTLRVFLALTIAIGILASSKPAKAQIGGSINQHPSVSSWLNDLGNGPDNKPYLLPEGKIPNKKALIISNWNYSGVDKLNQAKEDLVKARAVFGELDYELTEITNFNTKKEFGIEFKAWLRGLTSNDIVAIYYSGHGFTYDGREYLVPLTMPKNFSNEWQLKGAAVDLRTLISNTADAHADSPLPPRFIWVVFDGCRTRKNISISGKEIDEISKGDREEDSPKGVENVDYLLASRSGHPAYAPGKLPVEPSHFTSAFYDLILVNKYGCEGVGCANSDLPSLYADLNQIVKRNTGHRQKPERLVWASTKLVLKDLSDQSLELQRYKWRSSLAGIIRIARDGNIELAKQQLEIFKSRNAYSIYMPQINYIDTADLLSKTAGIP